MKSIFLDKVKPLLYWTIIFIVATAMMMYGFLKPFQFQDKVEGAYNPNLTEGHRLMWSFYSYSLFYPVFIGLFEVLGALSLFWDKTRLFGCVLLSVILTNIIIQDYIYEVSALSVAIYYQILIFILLIFEYDKIKKVIKVLFAPSKKRVSLWLLIFAFLLAILCQFLEAKLHLF